MIKYITIDTSTHEGVKKAEKYYRRGWKMVRSGLFLIYFSKKV